jgi:ankyrin repeat protein
LATYNGRLCENKFHLQDGLTALIFAAIYGKIESVRMLLQVGADKDAKDAVRVLKYRLNVSF